MRTILTLLLFFPIFCFSQPITNIPDSIFEQRLIDLGYDTLHDGQVLTANIINIDSLRLTSPFTATVRISDLTGIEDFVNLNYLYCSYQHLTNLDLSQNPHLTHLICAGQYPWNSNIGLSNLNVSQNPNLVYLKCNSNELTSLDITQNNLLNYLECRGNNLTNLDISQNINLSFLDCNVNQLTSLDVSQNIALDTLDCSINQISNLDFSHNTNLSYLDCQQNPLILSLDLTQNTNLNWVFLQNNQLLSLDVRNGNNTNLFLRAENNPNLNCISVDDSAWAVTNWNMIDNHTTFSNNCYNPLQYTAIPDSIFEQKLIDLGYDNVHDGQVLTANISSIDSLDISHTVSFVNPPITDLTGLQDFTSLTYLDCSKNSLLNLDISQNTLLKHLNCEGFYWNGYYSGALQNLDLTNNDSLTYLNCIGNMISNLDLSNNYGLLKLYCSHNSIDTLNLSVNTQLTHLNCSKNNQIRSLDLSQNTSLVFFKCIGSSVFGSPIGKLQSLDIRNGNNINITTFNTSNNDSLYCISVDDSQWSSDNWTNIDSVTNFSNDCNASPSNVTNHSKKILIYPNPTNDILKIGIENFNGSFEAELYDFTGKLLETTNNTSLSLADYPTGIYLLKLAYGDSVEQLKVVKE